MTTSRPSGGRRTLVAFHAHPDDEALLTAGTMAKAAAAGHRVVLVLATNGDLGLTDSATRARDLGAQRLAEARRSADELGVARVEWLGYADSGMGPELYADPPGRTRFVRAPVAEAAQRLAVLLREESADVLLSYDARGGYGHRDHVRVHEVAAAAARLAGTSRVLEATIPRDLLAAAVRLSARVYRYPPEFDIEGFCSAFSARRDITHRIDVLRFAAAKRAAMRAHASQALADGADRTLAAFLRIPRPAYDLIFGREWFRDPAHPAGAGVARDIFAGLP
ncbi:MAG: PIG-L family deacetylase [Actinobacteria bacterium]|nr:PIG-L family deacetylase [Actinomycetota bacterium]